MWGVGPLEGWERRADQSSGQEYYVDHATRKTYWDAPPQLLAAIDEANRQARTGGQQPPHRSHRSHEHVHAQAAAHTHAHAAPAVSGPLRTGIALAYGVAARPD